MPALRAVMSGALAVRTVGASVSFLSIGDWGGRGLGGDYEKNELAVAKQMGETGQELGAIAVINTGDNFYYCGVQNLTDSQWQTDFEEVFVHESLMVPWYNALGNHDYAFDPEVQMKYKSPNNDRWQLPDYYYTKRIQLDGSQYATFIFIDTNPCIASMRGDDPSKWDPCSGKYGECLDDDGTCHLHEHIIAQDCSAQLKWFKEQLAAVDEEDWVIVIGHHPAYEIDVEDFTDAMIQGGVRLFLNGHSHLLKHYQMDGQKDIDFVTTGAGSMVHSADQDYCFGEGEGCRMSSHSHKDVYSKTVSGFSTHTFSEDFSTLTTSFVDTKGKVIHSFETAKKGGSPAPSPSPSPSLNV